METHEKQVDKTAYRLEKYGGPDRFASYHCQLKEIMRLSPRTMLEIGVGDKVVANYIKNNSTISYTSADIADDVGADVHASVTALPFEDQSFDVVCAFEVLEHLPFSEFDTALKELARVANRKVLLSLPHFGPPIKILWKIPFLPEMRFAMKIPFPRQHTFNGQHYWEIGKRGYSVRSVRRHIARHFAIEREYVPFDNQYHRFFVLTPKRA